MGGGEGKNPRDNEPSRKLETKGLKILTINSQLYNNNQNNLPLPLTPNKINQYKRGMFNHFRVFNTTQTRARENYTQDSIKNI